MGKVLALDYGKKYIGVATGDVEFKIAFPREVIENKSFLFVFKRIYELCKELDVKLIVVGMPFHMRGKELKNKMIKEVTEFFNKLGADLKVEGIEVILFDERLSSFEAESLMSQVHTGRKKMRIDAQAAQIILQRFFDSSES
ncbi:MAG: Holliday junction resolvase RuvX [Patescibacteria group bacterium]